MTDARYFASAAIAAQSAKRQAQADKPKPATKPRPIVWQAGSKH